MRKVRLISLFCLGLAFGLFCAHAGDMFVVQDKCYLPLFENNKEIRSFERGKKGCNCDDLDTVLLPGSVIEVLEYKENGMAGVTCEMTKSRLCFLAHAFKVSTILSPKYSKILGEFTLSISWECFITFIHNCKFKIYSIVFIINYFCKCFRIIF